MWKEREFAVVRLEKWMNFSLLMLRTKIYFKLSSQLALGGKGYRATFDCFTIQMFDLAFCFICSIAELVRTIERFRGQ